MSQDMSKEMMFIEITKPGGCEVLVPSKGKPPTPGTNELLIRVEAAGVNRPDILQREGKYNPPPGVSLVPGLEVAGTIIESGVGCDGWKFGDKVCALVAGGGYAEYCVAPSMQCLPIPSGLSFVEAAGLPETFFTVWANVFSERGLRPYETILIHGGSSGIGTTAIQLAKQFDSRVIVTVGSDQKCVFCERLGADRAVNYQKEDFVEAVKIFTDGNGADLILDMVGGEYIQRNMKAASVDGRIVQIAFLQGSDVQINLMPIMLKRLVLTGSTLRPRTVIQKGVIAKELQRKVWPLLENGKISPIIHATFPLSKAAEAHKLMESSSHMGKIVLTRDS